VSASGVLAYLAAITVIGWGLMHVIPTRAVADSFGEISLDNRRILVMEWIAEGITHIFIGVLVIIVTAIEGSGSSASQLVYRLAAAVLILLAALTSVTGARTPVIWFRVCPFVLGGAAILLLVASAV